MDELAIRATRAIGDTPAQGLLRAGEDLADAAGILEVDLSGMNMVTEAAGLDDGKETPADLGLFRLGELDRDDTAGEGTVEHGPEAFPHAGGVDENVLGMPGTGEGLEATKDGEVVFANPTVTGNDMVGGALEGGEGGQVDLDNGEGGGITAGIAKTEAGRMERVEAGFVHAGHVEEKTHTHTWGQATRPLPRPLPKWKYTFGEGRPLPRPSLRYTLGCFATPKWKCTFGEGRPLPRPSLRYTPGCFAIPKWKCTFSEGRPHPCPLSKSFGFGEGIKRTRGLGSGRNLVSLNQSQAGGGEQAGLGVDGLAEVLGADEGMVAAVDGEDALHVQFVGRNNGADIIGGVIKEAPDAIGLLGLQGEAALALEQGIGSPGGAPKDAGGVGTGGHGLEILIELGNTDGLGFVNREQQAGGSAEDIGTRLGGEELELGLAKLEGIAFGGFPEAARAEAGIEGGADAIHAELGLRLEGGGDGDDAPAGGGKAIQQPGEEVGLGFVLAGLAGQDDDKGEAEIVENGILDGKGNLRLVGAQADAAGAGPGNGGAADGGAEEGGESHGEFWIEDC